jgi:L,D-transpeptidase ErfK/SrfK
MKKYFPFPLQTVWPTALSAFIFSLLLSGCQMLQLSDNNESQLVVRTSQTNTIESHEFPLNPEQNIVGVMANLYSRENDTLSDIARHFGLGYNDITLANPGLDPWILSGNQKVLLPLRFILPDAAHQGIVLNLANMRLFYYPNSLPGTVITYPVGIGRNGWNTPLGRTEIAAKKVNPSWIVPDSIQREHQILGDPLPKVIQAGPENPLGNYAMPLARSGYLIHGTNKPYGIGMQVSHGCVQMYPEDIEVIFKKVDVGTPVQIVHQPYLATWNQDMLYLEAHPLLDHLQNQKKSLQKELRNNLKKLAAEKQATVDWEKVERILQRSDGIPTPILMNSDDLPELIANSISVQHPDYLYGQPIASELTDHDWAILAASYPNETDAQKLAAMLNHQGPPIPARMVATPGSFQVVAGPFKNKKETTSVAKRIKQNFELDVKTLKPKESRKN